MKDAFSILRPSVPAQILLLLACEIITWASISQWAGGITSEFVTSKGESPPPLQEKKVKTLPIVAGTGRTPETGQTIFLITNAHRTYKSAAL